MAEGDRNNGKKSWILKGEKVGSDLATGTRRTMEQSPSFEPDPEPVQLSGMFIRSSDTLHGTLLDQKIPVGWSDRPPLLYTKDGRETHTLLKGVIRRGVPPALRCAVWLSSIVQTVHPHQTQAYWHEYRTLSKARVLDAAYDRLLENILGEGKDIRDDANWEHMETPTYGRSGGSPVEANASPEGRLAMKKVLLALHQILGFDYAPMVPNLTGLFLSVMSESYAFCAMREFAHNVGYYYSCQQQEYQAWSKAFGIIMMKLHSETYDYLDSRGVLEVDGLKPIFQDMFVGILQPEHVKRIIDIFTLEGLKVIYRFGIALLDLFKNESAVFQMIARNDEFWASLRIWTHDPRFNFEHLVSRAYGNHGRGPSRRFGRGRAIRRFPRRPVISRIIKMENARLTEEGEFQEIVHKEPAKPLGLIEPATEDPMHEKIKAILAQPVETRRHLAEWLPLSLSLSNMDLLYSTNHHGRLLEIFYPAVKRAKHTIVIFEILDKSQAEPTIAGMYASQAWRESPRVYGDGECMIFRLDPKPKCWKWRPRVNVDDADFEENSTKAIAILEQFMVSTRNFISMGGSPDGSSGLRLNEDFTKGESSSAAGFDNEPLCSSDSVFDVGLVEVYGLVSPW
mmetsp:Transcript_26945/g.41283  ORF Transcript_26945/g.41283 Transcript_26945/m.41283 type:complete len:623 (+) Transcript_26945:65-1933(+)